MTEAPTVTVKGHHPFTLQQKEEIDFNIDKLSTEDKNAFYDMSNVFPERWGNLLSDLPLHDYPSIPPTFWIEFASCLSKKLTLFELRMLTICCRVIHVDLSDRVDNIWHHITIYDITLNDMTKIQYKCKRMHTHTSHICKSIELDYLHCMRHCLPLYVAPWYDVLPVHSLCKMCTMIPSPSSILFSLPVFQSIYSLYVGVFIFNFLHHPLTFSPLTAF